MLIPIKKVAAELGLSETSVRELVRQGKLEKHKMRITRGAHAARYDLDEVRGLKVAISGAAKPPATPPPGPQLRPASRGAATATPSPSPTRRAKALIDFG
jgi:hypothetical protein